MRQIDFFDRGATLAPDRICLMQEGASLTYRAAQRLSFRIANALLAHGWEPGESAAVYSPNDITGFVCCLGVMRSGIVWVPLNARYALDDLVHHMHLGHCATLFFHSEFEDRVPQLRARVPSLRCAVCIDRDSPYGPALAAWLRDVDETPTPPPPTDDPDAVFRLAVTGGTTGKPKGVLQTHRMAETNIASFLAALRYDTPPVCLVAAPMTHAAGVTGFHALALGGTMAMLPKADPLAILQSIEAWRVTTLLVPSTLLYMLLAHPRVREFDYSSLRYFFFGTSPTSADKIREAIGVFGPVMGQIYGQTEASLFLAYMSPEDTAAAAADPALAHRLLSCGRAGPLTHLAIMDDAGRLLPDGERGELVLRSGMVMKGYLDAPEETAAASRFGWHHTSDIAVRDADGFFSIVDRKRDLIISGGFNVFPSEVEQVIWSHPAVQDCAVIGVPDEKWGEAVKAVVELREGAGVDEAELIALCREKLGAVKAPKSIEFWPSLPRSAVGKVLKREVRQRFWAGQERAI